MKNKYKLYFVVIALFSVCNLGICLYDHILSILTLIIYTSGLLILFFILLNCKLIWITEDDK